MAEAKVNVLRRFPTYDFVMFVPLPPQRASNQLDEFLRNQKRPRGFVLVDPRVDGIVEGSTFSFRRRRSGLGGSVSPSVEGYFVPEGEGSNVFVRVQMSEAVWALSVVFVIGVIASLVVSGDAVGLLMVPVAFAIMFAFTAGQVWLEASRAMTLLHDVERYC